MALSFSRARALAPTEALLRLTDGRPNTPLTAELCVSLKI